MKFKPLVDEEDERRRASAAAKLRALDEAIAKRKAEEERYISLPGKVHLCFTLFV